MVIAQIEGVKFIVVNTDAQALHQSSATIRMQIGEEMTRGLGAGANPVVGRKSAEEDIDRLTAELIGLDMLFITAGMGGGTGTGAAPIIAKIAKELGILTVAVVTRPFSFEGQMRKKIAEEGIKELCQYVDSLIILPNNKLMKELGKNVSLLMAFKEANNVLLKAVKGIAELITKPGFINVDFADVRTVMSEKGMAMMGSGQAVGENRAHDAAIQAIGSPLLEDLNLSGAKGILVNITGAEITLGEFAQIGEIVGSFAANVGNIVIGTVIDTNPESQDILYVTVVITGLNASIVTDDIPRNISRSTTASSLATPPAAKPGTRFNKPQEFSPNLLFPNGKQPVREAIKRKADFKAGPVAPNPTPVEYLNIPAFLKDKDQDQT
jgi:cell division protein FtsZ